jgi:hypothetical protein
LSSLASQHLSFREFLISTWNLCTLSHEALVHFVFELYDVDVSDALDGREFDKVAIEAIGGRDAARIMTGVHSIMSGRASGLTAVPSTPSYRIAHFSLPQTQTRESKQTPSAPSSRRTRTSCFPPSPCRASFAAASSDPDFGKRAQHAAHRCQAR